MDFDRQTDEIAITIPAFRMRHSADLGKNEIGIVSIAIDQHGESNPSPSLFTNSFFIPNVKKWSWVKFGGRGRIIYGPKNPGSFVYYNLLFVESDQDVRDFGNTLDEILKTDEAKQITNILSAGNPTTQVVSMAVAELGKLVARILSKNKNDLMYSTEGAFFQNVNPPYNIGDKFNTVGHHIECEVEVIPLMRQKDALLIDGAGGLQASLLTGDATLVQGALELEILAGLPREQSLA